MVFRSQFLAFDDIHFAQLTCYRGGCSPCRSFSCRTCSHSCVESRCAATRDLSLYLQSKKEVKAGKIHFKMIANCVVTQGSSHHRSKCRRLDVSGRRSDRRDNASLQASLRRTDFMLTDIYTATLVYFSVSAPSA